MPCAMKYCAASAPQALDQHGCRAHSNGNPERYPGRKATKRLPERSCQLLVIRNQSGDFLLEKRAAQGIWGGLWSFPQIDHDADPITACDRIAGTAPVSTQRGSTFRHTFSHFHLDATPVFLEVDRTPLHVMEDQRLIWYKPGERALGFAAPVKRLIDALNTDRNRTLEIF